MRQLPSRLATLALALSLTGMAMAQTPDPATVPAPAPEQAQVTEPAAPAQAAPVPAPVSSPVAAPTQFSEAVLKAIGSPVEGKAQVVFFRPSKFAGAMIGFIVREKDAELGKLRNGNYFVANVEPGKHTYTVHSEASDDTLIELEAGETYFVAGSLSFGFMAGHPHLAVSDVKAFTDALPKLSPSKPLS
jgi:hypothetical protein